MKSNSCTACGICCEMYGSTINAHASDLSRWKSEGRSDILAHVGPERELWFKAGSEERLAQCPFYVKTSPNKGGCSIHSTKPQTCQRYPTELHNWRCVTGAKHTPS